MLPYSLGLKEEAAILDHLVVGLESIQNRVVAVRRGATAYLAYRKAPVAVFDREKDILTFR
jgi:hypothetical protein